MKIVPDHVYARGTRDICYEPFESFGFLWFGGFLCWNIPPTKSQQQGMSSVEASELVAASASQKKIWISWKDKIEGTDLRKEKRKPVQTKLRKYMISFFPILVGLQHKPLTGADTVGSLSKLNLKLKYIIINIIWWLQRYSNKPELTHVTKNNDPALVDQTTDHFSDGYRVERNFCGSLLLRIGDFLCFAGTHNFCD